MVCTHCITVTQLLLLLLNCVKLMYAKRHSRMRRTNSPPDSEHSDPTESFSANTSLYSAASSKHEHARQTRQSRVGTLLPCNSTVARRSFTWFLGLGYEVPEVFSVCFAGAVSVLLVPVLLFSCFLFLVSRFSSPLIKCVF